MLWSVVRENNEMTNLIAHHSVPQRNGVRHERTLSVIRNPRINLDVSHWNAHLGVGFNQNVN